MSPSEEDAGVSRLAHPILYTYRHSWDEATGSWMGVLIKSYRLRRIQKSSKLSAPLLLGLK